MPPQKRALNAVFEPNRFQNGNDFLFWVTFRTRPKPKNPLGDAGLALRPERLLPNILPCYSYYITKFVRHVHQKEKTQQTCSGVCVGFVPLCVGIHPVLG